MADAVYSYHSFFSAPAHDWYRNPQALSAAMLAGEAVMLFIFEHIPADDLREA